MKSPAKPLKPNMTTIPIPGRTLEGNPLGDPTERDLIVYLPPSYDGQRRFPVIYLLSGFASTGNSFMNYNFGRPTVAEMAEALIREGRMAETIIVMPDCMTRYGGSQYVDSAGTGNYERYLTREIVPCVDAALRTIPERPHRAIAGKSSGGFGALRLAMKHPDLFGAAASHSGDLAFDLCYRPNFAAAARILEKHNGSLTNFFTRYETALKPPSGEFPLLDMLAMSAAYSPDPLRQPPENIRLPFNPLTCETDREVWNQWLSFDPVEMVEQENFREALRSLSLLFMDCGTLDEYNLQFGLRIFCRKLSQHNIEHRHEEFPDSHGSTSYRYSVSLPALASAIAG